MYRLLLIERSATLRHVLNRLLSGKGHETDVARDYASGHHLLHGAEGAQPYSAVVLGWPTHTDPEADELLSFLEEGPQRAHPVLIMAHEPEPAMRTWVSQRPNSAFVLWDNRHEVDEAVQRLLTPTAAPVRPTRLQTQRNRPLRVLLVDDSPSIRVYYRRLLSRYGYQADTAASVDEAMEKARAADFDIAIIDYFMPDANGDVLCRKLGEEPSTAGVITAILTGTYSDQVIRDCLEAGAVECMFKNEAEELFLARLAAMSRLSRARQAIETERQRLSGILSSVGDGVYGVNNDGIITFVNPAAKRILGYDEDQNLSGESPHTLFHYAREDGAPNPPESCMLNQAYGADRDLQSWEMVFWHRSKRPIPVECTVYPLRIQQRTEGSVVAFRDISERKSLEEKLRWQATHDPLTELLNRRHLEERLHREITWVSRNTDQYSALLHIDLDRFKYINDTAGHSTGDRVLIEVGRQLRSRLRATDTLARLGGDEFAVVLSNVDPETVFGAAESFRHVLNGCEFTYGGNAYRINASIGVAFIDQHVRSAGDVMANADIACTIAKRNGRNQTHVFVSESDERLAMDLDLGWSSRLRDALERDRFVLHFQPIVPVSYFNTQHLPEEQGQLWRQGVPWLSQSTHFEVLVRLRDEQGDIIAPNAFIPTAERFNMMQEIDCWVIEKAIAKLSELCGRGQQSVFSINLSGHSLDDRRLLPLVVDLLETYDVDPGSLIFEVTETAAIASLESAGRFIDELTGFGCRFALDDFGSGFSSFAHLKHLAVDLIKIDGTFVQGMAKDPIDRAMVASMNDIAHSLGRLTIAEYVESADIVRLLKECGVDYMQGYYIAPPLPEAELEPPTYRN